MPLPAPIRRRLRRAAATALLVLLAPGAAAEPAFAFDPVTYAPPKVGLVIHFEIRQAGDGKPAGSATHEVTAVDGKEVTFSSKSEQSSGGRTFRFDDVVVSQYGLAPRRVVSGQTASFAVADWAALDGLWPLAPGRSAQMSFEIFRTALKDMGKPGQILMRGRTTFRVLRAETIQVLGAPHEAIVLERETQDEILASKTPIARTMTYRIWWSRKVNWMVRMETTGTTDGRRHGNVVTVTKLIVP